MKIAFLLTQSLDSPSGLGRFGPLARELAALGHQVEVLALHPDWRSLPRRSFADRGVQVRYVSQMHVRKPGAGKTYYGPLRLLLVSLAATRRLARALARSDADIIQLGKAQPFNVLAMRLARRDRPVFCDCDDYEAVSNRFAPGLSGRWQRAVVRYFEDGIIHDATGLTTNTRFSLDRYTGLGFPPARMRYVPNGVERDRFARPIDLAAQRAAWSLPPQAPVVMYVGSLGLISHPVDLLLRAFQQVRRTRPEARLILVGGGEDFARLQRLSAAPGLGEAVVFTGRVAAAAVPEFLALADVTVDPVHDDLTARARSPLKIVESLAAGVPVVTADVGDRRAMLADGDLGELVPAGDADALADGILRLLQSPERRQAIRRRARRENRWYWDQLVRDFAAIYDLAG